MLIISKGVDISLSLFRSFFWFWGALNFSLVGKRLTRFVLIWWLTQEANAASLLTSLFLAMILPTIIASPFIGILVDRFSRKKIIIIAELVSLGVALTLVALFMSGTTQAWHIFLLVALNELALSVIDPAFYASMTLMVPEKHFIRIQGINQSLFHGLDIIAAPLGALLLKHLSMANIISLTLITSLTSLLILLKVLIPNLKRQVIHVYSYWQNFTTAVQFLRTLPSLIVIIILLGLVNLFTISTSSLNSLLIKEHFLGTENEFAYLEIATSIGFLLGGFTLGAWGGFKKRIHTFLVALSCLGVLATLLSLLPSNLLNPALVILVFIAFTAPFIISAFLAIIQAIVPAELQGRIIAIAMAIVLLPVPIGLRLAVPVAETFGVVTMYSITGIACICLAIIGFTLPSLRRLEA